MNETDEPQGFERMHNVLNINQSNLGVVTYVTNRLKSALKQHVVITRGKERIDYRLSYSFYTMYYNNVEAKKIDCEYTYTMPVAILTRHAMPFDNAHFFAQLCHPVLQNNTTDMYIKRHFNNIILPPYY